MKSFKYILAGLMLLSTVSCQKDFFDQVPDDKLTIEQVFQRRDLSEQYLANVYNYIKDEGWVAANFAPWVALSDEGDITYDRAGYNTYPVNIGNWSPSSTYFDSDLYNSYYKGIRSASYFIEHIGGNIELLNTTNGDQLIKQWSAEARAVRCWLYFNLLRAYGPFMILPEGAIAPDTSPDDPLLHLSRSSYDECVSFLVSELDNAAKDLPLHFSTAASTNDYGRMTQLFCMALKSRVLLYAASPLFNGNADYANFKNPDGKALMNTTYNKEKWKLAADAAKAIIDLNKLSLFKKNDASGNFDAFLSCRDVFLTPWNSEWIFARTMNNLAAHERHNSPRTNSGYASNGITQQQVDAYFMANGKQPITGYNADGSPVMAAGTGYTETGYSTIADRYTRVGTYNMYMNREPRFYVSVNFNGVAWINTSEGVKVIATNFNGESGKSGSYDYSRTGYFIRKNIDPGSNPKTNTYVKRPYVMMRYAEILLNYAEALNEYDPGNADILKYLNLIRERAGVAQYGVGAGALPVPADMREAIRAERRVELAFEHHRYFDTRRWKIAEQTDGGAFWGMNVDANPPLFYTRTRFETRVFQKSYYLFPIPQPEIDKNKNMVQNPYW